ncbi:MAG: transposase [Marinifilaceae bacterium]
MGAKSRKLYSKKMRMIVFYDLDKDEEFKFITNNQDISSLEITYIYKNRWQIEVFFKWIKQNLTIKTLWGNSKNAVSYIYGQRYVHI